MPTLRQRIFGKPRDVRDPSVFHHISLIAFFAWVGLGADGLSSSAYGPEEAFKHLVDDKGIPHYYLSVFLAIATALTVFIISYAYSRIIEHFPHGGGGYLVATKLLGEHAGVISGSALLVDYVLTISISTASGANAIFALLPPKLLPFKFVVEIALILVLVIMNLRGVKESVVILTPIFLCFVITHVIVIVGVIVQHAGSLGTITHDVREGLRTDGSTLGRWALLLLFVRAYSLGGGTYTGIEAVSNGLQILREPRVQTGKRTMRLMAFSLALTAGGIILGYLLLDIRPSPYDGADPRYIPMNAFWAKAFAGQWHIGGLAVGKAFVVLTLLSEGALLFVAAQTGFIDGPRVMANMALDSWVPHKFAALSERLTMRNGVYLMGGAALLTLLYTHGSVDTLAVMYSINVFLTFSLSNLGMSKFWWTQRGKDPTWNKHIWVHLIGLGLCSIILVITVLEKFAEGGWITLLATSGAIALCYGVRAHYRMVGRKVAELNQELEPLVANPDKPAQGVTPGSNELDPDKPTAVLLAGGYGGLGAHTLLQINKLFPDQFKQVIFISVGVVDSGTFKGKDEIEALEANIRKQLDQYVKFARNKLGWNADSDMVVGAEAVAEIERLCREVHLRFPRSMFFAGKLVFREPTWWHRLLHNETAHSVQRRLEFDGLPMVILPVRMLH
jgi:amino acid transporter